MPSFHTYSVARLAGLWSSAESIGLIEQYKWLTIVISSELRDG